MVVVDVGRLLENSVASIFFFLVTPTHTHVHTQSPCESQHNAAEGECSTLLTAALIARTGSSTAHIGHSTFL